MMYLRLTLIFAVCAVLLGGCKTELSTTQSNLDRDEDGFVNIESGGDDCNDSNPEINPDAEEVCDNLDNDCDGFIDCEDDLADADGDGVCVCDDCDDNDAQNFGGNQEICDGIDNDCDGFVDCVDPDLPDEDGDGACVCNDCDDTDGINFPNNIELCDGFDNDCDGEVDEDLVYQDWYQDVDGDGHGDPGTHINGCEGAPGPDWVNVGDDCDDADGSNFPGNNEICDDQDNDCDTYVDEDLVFMTLYVDSDGDGWGDDNNSVYTCPGLAGAGYVLFSGDCDDSNALIAPDASEVCDGIDNDCDALVDCADPGVPDADGDGFCVCDDCDDNQGWNWPGNVEICDGQDNDCNGLVDCADSAIPDADGDGDCECTDCDDADPLNSSTGPEVCDGQDNDCDGLADCADPGVDDADGDGVCTCQDCDDSDADNYPGNVELCDSQDNNCDGAADEGLAFVSWYLDLDGDLRGDPATEQNICDGPPAAGWVQVGDDCDDMDPANYPTNNEACDGQDNNCDGVADEGLPVQTLYLDDDGDGFGDSSMSQDACLGGGAPGYISTPGDCDDADPAINPGATEACNGIDDDCDAAIDCLDIDVQDADGDGYCVCDDCDDLALWNFPGNIEICDGQDNDCDGTVDCGDADLPDADGDGVCVCEDCDDSDVMNFPGNTEMCDGGDNDCDGFADCTDPDTPDTDGDGVCECIDCDDANPSAFPGNFELCDGIDSDCDGVTPADELTDADGDGFVACEDCDDGNSATNPSAAEICDGQDNDCDGSIPGDEVDSDGDGYWRCEDCDDLDPTQFLDDGDADGDGYSVCAGDCMPNDPAIFPGAAELCDLIDNDCDIDVDEDFVNAGRYDTDAHCGFCGNDCSTYVFANAVPVCDAVPAVPVCAPQCDPGWFDVNQDSSDGCECEVLGVDDPFDGSDGDCNGDDGDHATAVHVALWGASGATGTLTDPVRDIQEAVDLAVAQGMSYVLVSQGAYYESVLLDASVTLVGGYSFDFGELDSTLYETIVDGDNTTASLPGTITLACDGSAQRIQGFTILGTLPDDAGESSYGIHLTDCDDALQIVSNEITARDGADGTAGGGGLPGAFGSDGSDGQDAQQTTCVTDPQGGPGGSYTCGAPSISEDVSGGRGGNTLCPIIFDQWTERGVTGSGVNGGMGGSRAAHCEFTGGGGPFGGGCTSCTNSQLFSPGGVGESGFHGVHGASGAGCSDTLGQVSGNVFVASGGGQGGIGDNGGGGGGGGAGAGAETNNCGDPVSGGTGGGGGSGGCGAEGGLGGTGGGGSFGLFLVYNAAPAGYPDLQSNSISSQLGGDGGAGGSGGVGGVGGVGGYGGAQGDAYANLLWAGRAGGDGGNGGNGGHGGGGGGGCGGPSFALFVSGASPAATYGDASILAAQGGGLGGVGGAAPGGTTGIAGSIGSSADKNF